MQQKDEGARCGLAIQGGVSRRLRKDEGTTCRRKKAGFKIVLGPRIMEKRGREKSLYDGKKNEPSFE